MSCKITILGAGAFGTSMATVLANNGYEVLLWAYEKDLVESVNSKHQNNLYFPNFKLDEKIKATNNLKDAFEFSKNIIQAIPVKFLRNVLMQTKDFVQSEHVFVSLSKGIEKDSLLFPTQIIKDIFQNNVAVLSGPSFAQEIAEKKYTVTTLATENKNLGLELKKIFENDYFKIEQSTDLIGVQVGGAFKNLVSVLIGIAKGSGAGHNIIAYLITKGLHEMAQLSEKLSGEHQTVYGISGFGDLILSATGLLGRNLEIGEQIGKLKNQSNFDPKMFFKDKILPEGINTIESTKQLLDKLNLNLKFFNGTYKLVFDDLDFYKFLKEIGA
jgi:glycerol-3-phosphate dehydrogenase (NAD(P)+)